MLEAAARLFFRSSEGVTYSTVRSSTCLPVTAPFFSCLSFRPPVLSPGEGGGGVVGVRIARLSEREAAFSRSRGRKSRSLGVRWAAKKNLISILTAPSNTCAAFYRWAAHSHILTYSILCSIFLLLLNAASNKEKKVPLRVTLSLSSSPKKFPTFLLKSILA